MTKRRALSTRVLLICAAIGVATGLLSVPWAGLHLVVAVGAVPLYGFILGFHVLPGVIAQQVLRTRWVALITHGVAALISIAFVPAMVGGYLLAAVVFGGVQEGVSAALRYRHWQAWRFLVSSAITGFAVAVPLWFAFDVDQMSPWAGVGFAAIFVLGPVVWTVIGLGIGGALRRAGIIRG